MRWNKKDTRKYQSGDTRIRSGFLLLPKMIGDEIRWLERATWRETFIWVHHWDGVMFYWSGTEWVNE